MLKRLRCNWTDFICIPVESRRVVILYRLALKLKSGKCASRVCLFHSSRTHFFCLFDLNGNNGGDGTRFSCEGDMYTWCTHRVLRKIRIRLNHNYLHTVQYISKLCLLAAKKIENALELEAIWSLCILKQWQNISHFEDTQSTMRKSGKYAQSNCNRWWENRISLRWTIQSFIQRHDVINSVGESEIDKSRCFRFVFNGVLLRHCIPMKIFFHIFLPGPSSYTRHVNHRLRSNKYRINPRQRHNPKILNCSNEIVLDPRIEGSSPLHPYTHIDINSFKGWQWQTKQTDANKCDRRFELNLIRSLTAHCYPAVTGFYFIKIVHVSDIHAFYCRCWQTAVQMSANNNRTKANSTQLS